MKKFLAMTAFMDSGCPFRRRNLEACINRVREAFPDADHVVVEQGTGEWSDAAGLDVLHRTYDLGKDFHKTALLNRAVIENPGYDGYIMVDADVYIGKEMVDYILANINDDVLVFPFGDTLYLDETDTRKLVSDGHPWEGNKDHGITISRQTGLCNAFTRGAFDRVGGYDECFKGWGAEDDAFMFKFKRVGLTVLRNPDRNVPAIHMFHPKLNTPEYIAGDNYLRNRQMCACIRRMGDSDFTDYIAGRRPMGQLLDYYRSIGRLNVSLEWNILPGTMLQVDTTIFDVDRSKDITIDAILDAVLNENGPAETVEFIDSVLLKIPGLDGTDLLGTIKDWRERLSR